MLTDALRSAALDRANAALRALAERITARHPDMETAAREVADPTRRELATIGQLHRASGFLPSPYASDTVRDAMRYDARVKRACVNATRHSPQEQRLEDGAAVLLRILKQIDTYQQEAAQRIITQLIVSASVYHLVGDLFFQNRAWFVRRFPYLANQNPWVAIQLARRIGKSAATSHVAAAMALQKPGISIGILGNTHRVTQIMLRYIFSNLMAYLSRPDCQLPIDPRTGRACRPQDIKVHYNQQAHVKIIFPDGTVSAVHAYPAKSDVRHTRTRTHARTHASVRARLSQVRIAARMEDAVPGVGDALLGPDASRRRRCCRRAAKRRAVGSVVRELLAGVLVVAQLALVYMRANGQESVGPYVWAPSGVALASWAIGSCVGLVRAVGESPKKCTGRCAAQACCICVVPLLVGAGVLVVLVMVTAGWANVAALMWLIVIGSLAVLARWVYACVRPCIKRGHG